MKTFKRLLFWFGVICACIGLYLLLSDKDTAAAALFAITGLVAVIIGSPK